jgi:hypothetical protein
MKRSGTFAYSPYPSLSRISPVRCLRIYQMPGNKRRHTGTGFLEPSRFLSVNINGFLQLLNACLPKRYSSPRKTRYAA